MSEALSILIQKMIDSGVRKDRDTFWWAINKIWELTDDDIYFWFYGSEKAFEKFDEFIMSLDATIEIKLGDKKTRLFIIDRVSREFDPIYQKIKQKYFLVHIKDTELGYRKLGLRNMIVKYQ